MIENIEYLYYYLMQSPEQHPTETKETINTNKEIERKYALGTLPPNLESFPQQPIQQGYAFLANDGTEVRVRHDGEKFLLTGKVGQGKERVEVEREITADQFASLWQTTRERRIEKTRYAIPLKDGGTAELDLYHGQLEGFVTTEVEFASNEEADRFVAPDWFGQEVTDNGAYHNQRLAVSGRPDQARDTPESGTHPTNPEYDIDQGLIVARMLIDLKRAMVDRPVIVALAGGSASGKTSAVGQRLVDAYGEQAGMLSLDNYYRGGTFMAEQKARGHELTFDQPEAVDLLLVAQHLGQLRDKHAIEEPIYSFANGGTRTGTKPFEPRPVIVAEGLFTLDTQLSHVSDVKIYVDIGTHGQFLRRIMRDVNRTDWPPQQIIDYFSTVVVPMHEKYVATTKTNADIVIRNEYRPIEEADRAGMYEQQLKFPTALTHEQLRKLGAEKLSQSHQIDHYLNPRDRQLTDSDEILRIREEGETKTLGYKGPKKTGLPYRKRPKFEFEIDDQIYNHFLTAYGQEFITIDKERTMYRYNNVLLSIDSVKKTDAQGEHDVGSWTEIRFPNEILPEEVDTTIRALGLDPASARLESYLEI